MDKDVVKIADVEPGVESLELARPVDLDEQLGQYMPTYARDKDSKKSSKKGSYKKSTC